MGDRGGCPCRRIALPGQKRLTTASHAQNPEVAGAFNIAGKGTIPLDDMGGLMGNRPAWVPSRILYPLNHIAWTLRLHFITRFPSVALGLFRYSRMASPQRFIDRTRFSYRYDSRSAFGDFARHAGRSSNAHRQR